MYGGVVTKGVQELLKDGTLFKMDAIVSFFFLYSLCFLRIFC